MTINAVLARLALFVALAMPLSIPLSQMVRADARANIEVSEAIFDRLTSRVSRIQSLENTPVVSLDHYRDFPDAISLKNMILEDDTVDAGEAALLRAILSSSPSFVVRHREEVLQVTNLRHAAALDVLRPLLIGDFGCAVAYWLHGGLAPSMNEAAMERARFAASRYQQANPGADMAAVEQQMLAEVQARGQRIQQGTESAEQLQADLTACEAQYGF